MVFLKANVKKGIAVTSMVILAAANITAPINLKDMLPGFVTDMIIQLAAFGTLVGAWWVFNKQV